MRMDQEERRFDFHGLGAALKRAREEKGWTQAYVAELVDRDSRTIMNIENKGQYPSFDLFVKLITMFDVSVDQFIHADGGARSSSCRKHIDVLLNSMNYNFPQGRVTDHRIGYTTHDLNGFLAGDIQDMIDALTVAENAEPYRIKTVRNKGYLFAPHAWE